MSNRRSLIGETAIMMGVDNVPEPIIDINNYLTMVALEDGLTAKLSVNACEYCVDGDGNWKTLPAATNTETINTGHTLSFRGNLTPDSSNGIGRFTISKKFNLEGNCMSMLFGDEAADNKSLSAKNYAFSRLFRNCTTVKSVSSGFLPATTLASNCYESMFRECTSLTQAPALPATAIANYCYRYMFQGCTSLTQAPELPATTLAEGCYANMFNDCISLTTAPELPAKSLVSNCYRFMFYGCTKLNYIKAMFTTTPSSSYTYYWVKGVASTGTFVKNTNATWNVTGVHGILSGWSVQTA